MPLISCESCKKEYSDKLDQCFHCGEPNTLKKETKSILMEKPPALLFPSAYLAPNSNSEGEKIFIFIIKAICIILVLVGILYYVSINSKWYQDYIDRSKTLSTGSTSQTDSSEYSYTNKDNTPAEADYDDPSIPNLNSDEEYRKTIFGDYAEGQKFVLVGKVGQVMADGFVIHTKQLLSGNPFSLGDMIMSAANPLFLGNEIVVRFKGNPRILDGDIVQIKGRFQSVSQYEITLTKSKTKMPNFVGDYYDTTRSDNFFKNRKEAIDNENKIKQLTAEAQTKNDELQEIWTSLPNQLQNNLFKEYKAWVISHNASCRAIADTIASLKCHIDGVDRRIDYLNSKKQKYLSDKALSDKAVATDTQEKADKPQDTSRQSSQSLGNDDTERGSLNSQVAANANANSVGKYTAQIKSHIKSAWHVPIASSGLTATARFTLSSNGSVASVVITQSSGNDGFDASIKALRSLNGLPVPDDTELFNRIKDMDIGFSSGGDANSLRKDVGAVMSQNASRVQGTFKRALDDDPNMQGSFIVHLKIAPDGHVISVNVVSSDLNNSALEGKLKAMIQGFQFGSGSFDTFEGNYKYIFN